MNPDDFTVKAEGTRIFQYQGGNAAGVAVDRNGYRAVYVSFDFADIASAANEQAVIANVMRFLVASDVPWLSQDPISGTVSADGGSLVIDVTLDASVPKVSQPGSYLAVLDVWSNDPFNSNLGVPVTMTVNAPATFAKLIGTVTGLGYCDVNPVPLEDLEVLITDNNGMTYTLVTDASGAYGLWFDESVSPLTVSVAPVEYEIDYASNVTITGQVTTTRNFDLRWLQPCVNVQAPALSDTLVFGMQSTLQITLSNTGAVATDFELGEKDKGFVLMAGEVRMAGEVLVVNEDDDAALALEAALAALGYTSLDVESGTFTGMTITELLTYEAVFYTGFLSGDSEQPQVAAYLDAGGRFFNVDDGFAGVYCSASYTFCSDYWLFAHFFSSILNCPPDMGFARDSPPYLGRPVLSIFDRCIHSSTKPIYAGVEILFTPIYISERTGLLSDCTQ